jgi:glycosyltransferase involved in cell wall biosynthesis
MPSVSVIIPTRDRSDFLPIAIESVRSQTFQDLEIIVIDDASGDDTAEVVASIQDPRIRYVRHDARKHVSETRNTGIRKASGDFVAFLDDDDAWLPTKVDKQLSAFASDGEGLGAVYTDFTRIDRETGRVLGDVRADPSLSVPEQLRARNFIGTASSVMVRRACFADVGLFDPAIEFGEDYDMWIRLAENYRLAGVPESLVHAFVHRSALSRERSARLRGLTRLLQKHATFFEADRPNYSRRYRVQGMLYSDALDTYASRASFRAALRIDPFSLQNYVYLLSSYLYSPRETSRGAIFDPKTGDGASRIRTVLRAAASRLPRVLNAYRLVRGEVKTILYAARNGLWTAAYHRRSSQRTKEARQKPLKWRTNLALQGNETVTSSLSRLGIGYREGGHSVYVGPQPDLAQKLGSFVQLYPPDAGFKILKERSGPAEAKYVRPRQGTWAQSSLVGTADDLTISSNYLSELGIIPRLYDLAELDASGVPLTAFVTEHVAGGEPSEAECRNFIRRIHELVDERRIAIAVRDWEIQEDFLCPSCCGNLLKSKRDGSLKYVDFQNFVALDLDKTLQSLVTEFRENLHFGTECIFRGGRYLYQRVPGMSAGGRRDTEFRWDTIRKMLQDAKIDLSGIPVFDVGCNAGMMLAQALNEGALWGIGWDLPPVVDRSRRLLSALGYTRYTLVGATLSAEYPLAADVPTHLQDRLADSVVLYLAIRHHVGFLKALRDIPWKALVYEGPQLETGDELERVLGDLKRLVPCEVVSRIEISDADSWRRPLVLVKRS